MISIIHYVSKWHPFNGNIFNNFEYFIFLLKKGIDVKLYIVSNEITLDSILFVMNDRYNLEDVDYNDHIIFSYDELPIKQFDLVIINSKTIYDLDTDFDANEIHLVNTWASYFEEFRERVEKFCKNKSNIIVYNECNLCGETNYIRPIYIDLLKKPKESEDNIFLHVSGVRGITLIEFLKFVAPRMNKRIITSFPENQNESMDFLTNLDNVDVYTNHIPGLFSKFDTYFYIMLRSIDYSPRMLIECSYLNKEIIFVDKTNTDHGGVKRYNDILNGDIDKYLLTENDKLVKRIC